MDAAQRVAELNESQRRFLRLHAFDAPHHWIWLGVDWVAHAGGAPRNGRLRARSQASQATISAEDLRAIDDCWQDQVFPNVRADISQALTS